MKAKVAVLWRSGHLHELNCQGVTDETLFIVFESWRYSM